MNVTLTLSEYDARHRLKRPPRNEESRSFVKAFLQLYYTITTNLTQSIIDITNTSRTVSSAALGNCDITHPGLDAKDSFAAAAGIGTLGPGDWPYAIFSDEKGIIVGTSSTAIAVADDNLVAPIAHGTSAGEFIYYGCCGLNYTTGASSASFDIERIFRNSSGGSIVVAEIGIYAATGMSSETATSARAFCILRDVISPTVTVNNGEYLKVKYTITVSN